MAVISDTRELHVSSEKQQVACNDRCVMLAASTVGFVRICALKSFVRLQNGVTQVVVQKLGVISGSNARNSGCGYRW